MGGQVRCYIKQKTGVCLLGKIKALDEKIIEQKQHYQFIVQEMKQIYTYLEEKQCNRLMAQNLKLYDGFNWEHTNTNLKDKHLAQKCPYQLYGCEAIYTLKKDVLDYHCSRLLNLLADYNQMMTLLLAAQRFYNPYKSLKKQMVLNLCNQPFWSLGYYLVDDFNPYQKNEEMLYLFYFSQSRQILMEKVRLFYRTEEEVIKGTYLSLKEKKALWIQVIIEKSMMDEQLVVPILKSLHVIISYLNQKYKKAYGRIVGSYMEIGELEVMQRKKLIQLLKPLGYKAVGQIKENQFKEEQLLIYKETTLNKTYLRH